MPRRARQMADSGIYHVMLRGINREAIFIDVEDPPRFLLALARAKAKSGCALLAYSLMSNHVHLLLQARTEPLGDTVRRVGVSYAVWFNRKYGRVGHVFQNRFRSLPVENDAYFINVCRYIWNNPVSAHLVAEPADYRWNSCSPLTPTGLVDDRDLDGLLPSLGRAQLAAPVERPASESKPLGRPRKFSTAEAARLLEVSCGARSFEEFVKLDPLDQRRVVCELRIRQVPFAVIAAVTGLTKSTAHRLQLAG